MSADVCLVLEDSYPYVGGGPADGIHELISMLPKLSFTLVHLDSGANRPLTRAYELPANVTGIRELFPFDDIFTDRGGGRLLRGREIASFNILQEVLHRDSRVGRLSAEELENIPQIIPHLFPANPEKKLFRAALSPEAWRRFREEQEMLGRAVPSEISFDSWQAAHLTIYRVLGESLPRAGIYHAFSSGYAGLAAAAAAIRNRVPLLLTEHSSYLREKRRRLAEEHSPGQLDPWYTELLRGLQAITYGFASQIIAPFEGVRSRQLSEGAAPVRSCVIPEGIGPRLRGARRRLPEWNGEGRFRVGLVGQLGARDEVKTFLKAARIARESYPTLQGRVVGSTERYPRYHAECLELMELLELRDTVQFVGELTPEDTFEGMDCLLYAGLSELPPRLVLEASSAGVPVVATDSVECRELLEGREPADKRLGPSGVVVPAADSEAMARAVLKLIRFPEIWDQMSQAGMQRVAGFYEDRELVDRYDLLYRRFLSRGEKLPWDLPEHDSEL